MPIYNVSYPALCVEAPSKKAAVLAYARIVYDHEIGVEVEEVVGVTQATFKVDAKGDVIAE